MGNNCVNSKVSQNGILYSISCTLGWSKSADHRIVYNNVNKKAASTDEVAEGPGAVQSKPPEVVKIVEEAKKAEEKKSAETIARQNVIRIVKDEKNNEIQATKWEDVVKITKEQTKTARIVRPAPVAKPSIGKARKVESIATKKAHNVKRMASAGLQADSILKTKTGHLKEYFNLGHKLGHGQYGTTFLCVEKSTGKEYACKSIAKRKLTYEDDIDDVRREIEIMHHLSGHPHVISIKGAYEDAVAVHIVMELCTGGELFDRIVKLGHYTERRAAELARTIVGVIETCHSLGVMHRDLKPENFLFVNEDEDSPLKIIDFGLSEFFKPGQS